MIAELIILVASSNVYLDVFERLDDRHKNVTESCEFMGSPSVAQRAYGNRYSWAVPTDEAINAIKGYDVPVVDFGAGSGYWSKLLADQGVNVVAYDDWSWGRPVTWFPVQTGGIESLPQHQDRAMLLVWPPHNSMPLDALRAWDGGLLFYVGEVFRVNGSVEFFGHLSRGWHLERKISLPNWRGKVDALYVLRRGKPQISWLREAFELCAG